MSRRAAQHLVQVGADFAAPHQMEQRRADNLRRLAGDQTPLDGGDGVAVVNPSEHLANKALVEWRRPAIAGKKSKVREQHTVTARPHLEPPPVGFDQLARPGQGAGDSLLVEQIGRFDVYHMSEATSVQQQRVRHVPACPAVDLHAELEWLGKNVYDRWVKSASSSLANSSRLS